MDEREHLDDDLELNAPARLAEALRDLRKERVFVPPSVDEQILINAKAQLFKIRKRRSRVRAVLQWTALAASIVALACIVQLTTRPRTAQFAREDLNRDRRVDILDAFDLARAIKSGKPVPAAVDLNSDGRIDALDVEIIARRSVGIQKGGAS
jgi:hypothetical protein